MKSATRVALLVVACVGTSGLAHTAPEKAQSAKTGGKPEEKKKGGKKDPPKDPVTKPPTPPVKPPTPPIKPPTPPVKPPTPPVKPPTPPVKPPIPPIRPGTPPVSPSTPPVPSAAPPVTPASDNVPNTIAKELAETRTYRRDAAREEIWKRWGTATRSEPVRAELRVHAERTARLRHVLRLARATSDAPSLERAERLLHLEGLRHERAMRDLTASAARGTP